MNRGNVGQQNLLSGDKEAAAERMVKLFDARSVADIGNTTTKSTSATTPDDSKESRLDGVHDLATLGFCKRFNGNPNLSVPVVYSLHLFSNRFGFIGFRGRQRIYSVAFQGNSRLSLHFQSDLRENG
jgi:hypothetical protein